MCRLANRVKLALIVKMLIGRNGRGFVQRFFLRQRDHALLKG
jgi:hypothetical protein